MSIVVTNEPYGVGTSDQLHSSPEFYDIHEWFQQCVDQVHKDNGWQCDRLVVNKSWANRSDARSGHHHSPHRHPMSYLSGIFYLTEGSPTVFQDPLTPRTMNQLEIISGTYENAVAIEPTVGQLLIWPSWMIHWSVPHHGPEPRAVIAWNALPDGGINFGPYGQNMVNLKVN